MDADKAIVPEKSQRCKAARRIWVEAHTMHSFAAKALVNVRLRDDASVTIYLR